MTPAAIVDSAVRQGLSVIAITDHNSAANVRAAIDHAQQQYSSRLLVIAGVEVTTSHGHLLVYFAPDRVDDLGRFLMRLELVGDPGDDNTHTAKSMADTIAEADRLGGISVAAHIDRAKTGFESFGMGFQNWKKDILCSPGLYGLECDAADNLVWYSDDDAGPAGAERRKMLGARREVPSLAPRHYLAHVQGSDAHSMAQFERTDRNKPWTRVKLSSLTFAALRTAFVDPTARVRATAAVPRAIPRVRGIAITGGFLHGQTIHFSDNLNCFIGGRGTGKSTAIRAIAYAFGINDEFEEYDSCPDAVTVFCEDEQGIVYRYDRTRGGETDVKAKEDRSITDVPIDSFKIEYFGQGELAKIAEDPLKQPALFQEFLDRHTSLRDLVEGEEALVTSLRENAARLDPLERAFSQLAGRRNALAEIEKKLKIAEEGNLREVVATQSKLASEKIIRESIETMINDYTIGYSLANLRRDYDGIVSTAGLCTDDPGTTEALASIKNTIDTSNAAIDRKEAELRSLLEATAHTLQTQVSQLKASHHRLSNEVAVKLAELRTQGLATDLTGLEKLLRDKTTVGREIAAVEQRANDLKTCREERTILRARLAKVRSDLTERRKAQLAEINRNLAATIKDYTIFVRYDEAGITDAFESFLQEEMTGTYMPDAAIETLCRNITPSELADLVLHRNEMVLVEKGKVQGEWAAKLIGTLCYWNKLFKLQVLAKQPKPIITVRTKTTPQKEIPVLQLSDGQRHTILLTIAMLAESNVPLVIDQPEDDLDNAFIASSIVGTLRRVKERRQVILVTHNANIAVLGDSELILPMRRESDCGKTCDCGSIDAKATRDRVISILEGGSNAFERRREMYDH
jgi:DNA repair ATPase RecN